MRAHSIVEATPNGLAITLPESRLEMSRNAARAMITPVRLRESRSLRTPLARPGHEHQDRPEPIAMIGVARLMLAPDVPRGGQVDHLADHRLVIVQQVLAPRAQRASEPFLDRRAEALLRPIDQRLRDIAVQHLAQQ